MKLLIYSSDISNQTRPLAKECKLAKQVVNGFYDQGGREKELDLACSCDKNKTTAYNYNQDFKFY